MMRDEIPEDPELPQRPSRLVDRNDFPAVRLREELNGLLRAHDPDVAEELVGQIREEHQPLLRQIAQEGRATNVAPAVRRHAIAVLGRFPSPENLNVLTSLAQADDDPNIRSQALLTLANTKLQLAVPVLRDALASRDPVEATAAAKGLVALAQAFGSGAIQSQFRGERRKVMLERLNEVLAQAEIPPTKRAKPRQTTGDN
jgi:HEAT repeat protein